MDEIGATRLVIRCLVAESMEELAKKMLNTSTIFFFNMSLLGKFRCPQIHPTKSPHHIYDTSGCATGCKDGKLRLWDVATSELLTTFESHQDVMKTCCVGPTGGSWITAGHDQMVKLWDERSLD